MTRKRSLRTRRRRAISAPALAAVLAVVTAAGLLLGCGDEEPAAPAGDGQQPYLSVSEVESVLERSALDLVRTGGGDAAEDSEDLVDHVRYEDQSGREFELFVWKTARVARRERAALLAAARSQHGEDATAIRAANTVAVFPARASSVDAYRAAARAMSRLGAACIPGGDREERLRRLCFGDEGVGT